MRKLSIQCLITLVFIAGAGLIYADETAKTADAAATVATTEGAEAAVEEENSGMQSAAKFMPLGKASIGVKIPQFDESGEISCMMLAQEMTRVDDRDIAIKDMDIEFREDGEVSMSIDLDEATYNLEDRLISSDTESVIRRSDFTLVGDSLQFDTVNRHGRMVGKVRMVIHNSDSFAAKKKVEPAVATDAAKNEARPQKGFSIRDAARSIALEMEQRRASASLAVPVVSERGQPPQ